MIERGMSWVRGGNKENFPSGYFSPSTMVLYFHGERGSFPVAYLRKPRNLPSEDWEKVCRSVKDHGIPLQLEILSVEAKDS